MLPSDLQQHQLLKPNDILISLTGNVGRVSLCGTEGDCLLNQRVGLFVPHSPMLNEYIYQAISENHFLMAMIAAGQGAAQMNIGKSDVESFCIPITDNIRVLQSVANCLCFLDYRMINAKALLKGLDMQRQYLKANLFI